MHRIRAEQVHSDCRTPVRTVYRLPAFDDAGKRHRVGRIREFRPRTLPPPGRRRSAFPLVFGWEHISPARAFPELRQADHSCSWSTPTRRNANCAGPLCRPIAACDLGGRGAEQGPPAERAARGKLCTTFSGFWGPNGLPMKLETGADAFTAGGLTKIRDRGGNLEWSVKLLLGAQGVVRDGVVASAGLAGAEGRAGRQDVELDASFIAEDLRRQGSGGRWQGHQRDVVRPSHGLTTRLSD